LGLYTTSRSGNWVRDTPPNMSDDEALGLRQPSWRKNRMG
jgi:hypothetical protein